MENYLATMRRDLSRLRSSKKRLEDLFAISFAHADMVAYERLVDLRLEKKTYAELRKDIEAFAAYLQSSFPAKEGEYIAIDLANGPSFIIAFWGSLMAGYSPYLVNSYYPLSLRLRLLERLTVTKVITLSPDYPSFYGRPDILAFPAGGIPKEGTWGNAFAISSTLTGLEAKIAVYDGEAIAAEIENSESIVKKNRWFINDYRGAIKVAAILPFFHVFGMVVSYLWFSFYGRTIVFFRDLAPETVRATIIRHGVTHVFAPPLLFHKLHAGIKEGVKRAGPKKEKAFGRAVAFLEKLGDLMPGLALVLSRRLLGEVRRKAFGESPRFMISGGAYIDPEALRTINAVGYPLFNGYGTTEASIAGANLAKRFSVRTNGSIGSPFPNVRYAIAEDSTLVVSGKSLAREIIYLDGKTERPTSFSTNDLVREVDGQYFINGRKSDLFVSENGENVSPDLIERELSFPLANHFSLLELDGKLTLVVEYRKGIAPALIERELAAGKSRLASVSYGQCVASVLLTNDPIANPNAIKVSRARLRLAVEKGQVRLFSLAAATKEAEGNVPLDDTLALIEELFRQSLGKDVPVAPNSDYFLDLGGDSMGYISLLISLQSAFGVRFDLEKDRALRTPDDFDRKIKEGR